MPEPMIRMTDAAAERVRRLMALSKEPAVGLRVGVRSRGCSGLSYSVEYASERKPYEEAVETGVVTVLIDPTAAMFLVGSVMDYREGLFESGFTFENPNARGTCGCGESFHV